MPTTNEIKNNAENNNEIPILNRCENNLVKKPRIAKMLDVCERTVDNYLAEGMPHRKSSIRCVRFDEGEVLNWFKKQYGQQHRRNNHSNN